MSVTTGDANTDALLTELAALPTTFNNSLTGAVDINAAFTLNSGYLVRALRPAGPHTRPFATLQLYRALVLAALVW